MTDFRWPWQPKRKPQLVVPFDALMRLIRDSRKAAQDAQLEHPKSVAMTTRLGVLDEFEAFICVVAEER